MKITCWACFFNLCQDKQDNQGRKVVQDRARKSFSLITVWITTVAFYDQELLAFYGHKSVACS
jgi:hypothetical protein